jgi:hypothetical protein
MAVAKGDDGGRRRCRDPSAVATAVSCAAPVVAAGPWMPSDVNEVFANVKQVKLLVGWREESSGYDFVAA